MTAWSIYGKGQHEGATRREGGRGGRRRRRIRNRRGGLGSKSIIAKLQWAWAACPCPRAARTGVDKEPSTTLKSTGKMRQGNGPQKVAGQQAPLGFVMRGEQRQP